MHTVSASSHDSTPSCTRHACSHPARHLCCYPRALNSPFFLPRVRNNRVPRAILSSVIHSSLIIIVSHYYTKAEQKPFPINVLYLSLSDVCVLHPAVVSAPFFNFVLCRLWLLHYSIAISNPDLQTSEEQARYVAT